MVWDWVCVVPSGRNHRPKTLGKAGEELGLKGAADFECGNQKILGGKAPGRQENERGKA